MPFDNFTEDDFQDFSQEMNRPRSGLNYEKLGESLRKAASAADKIIGVIKIIEKAKRGNPRGLPF